MAKATNRTALITGATGGLGEAFAKVLSSNGWSLVLTGRDESKLKALQASLSAAPSVEYIVAELGIPTGAADLAAEIERRALQIDALINNAGFASYGKFHEIPVEKSTEMLVVNIRTLTELTRRLLPSMVGRRNGYILNVASTAAFVPGPLMATYYASKAYVLSFSEALAEELRATGVSVTCLCPGVFLSGFQQRADMGTSKLLANTQGTLTAEDIAIIGYTAMMKRKPLVIAGLMNQIGIFFTRFLPRSYVVKMILHAQEPKS